MTKILEITFRNLGFLLEIPKLLETYYYHKRPFNLTKNMTYISTELDISMSTLILPNFDKVDARDAQMRRQQIINNDIGPNEAQCLYHYSNQCPHTGSYTLEKMTYFYAFEPDLTFEQSMVTKHGKFKWTISCPKNIVDLRLLNKEYAPDASKFKNHFSNWLRTTASDDSKLDNDFYEDVFARLTDYYPDVICNGVFMFANDGYSEYVLKAGVKVHIENTEVRGSIAAPPVRGKNPPHRTPDDDKFHDKSTFLKF